MGDLSHAEQLMKQNGMPVPPKQVVDENNANTPPAGPDGAGSPPASKNQEKPAGEEKPTPAGDEKPTGSAEEQGEAAATDAEQAAALKAEADKKAAQTPKQVNLEEVDEETVLEILKKHGVEATSLEDLKPKTEKTPDQIAAEAKEEEENVVRYALDNKIYKSETLKDYALDAQRSARDIALEIFTVKHSKLDANLTPAQIEERFILEFAEGEDEEPWRTEEKAQLMDRQKEKYLRDKYAEVNNAKDLYRTHIQNEKTVRLYKSEVERQMAKLPAQLTYKVGDSEYHYEPLPATLDNIKNAFLESDQYEIFGKKITDPKFLAKSLQDAIIVHDLPRIIEQVAKAHGDEREIAAQKGRKNIPPNREEGTSGEQQRGKIPEHAQEIMNKNKK